jgi:sugar lactone lactonase YvrE
MTRLLVVLVVAAALATSAAAAGTQAAAFPSRIDLPDGFRPEGISTAGGQFFVGSIPTGAVYRGSLRTGNGAVLVPIQAGRAAIGLKVDRGRLFVAGGPTGDAFVYNAKTGQPIVSYELASDDNTFVNDVVVTKRAAWFTDSFKPVLYRVPLGPSGTPGAPSAVQTVNLTPPYEHQAGAFNVNGIDATPNGKTLVIVQSGTGKLFTVTASGQTKAIALASGESVPNGDGLLLDGRRLYVVQNQLNVVAKIQLSPGLTSGRVPTRIGNPGFDVPTTIAEHGNRLYAVNARFNTTPTPTTDYWVTQLRK